jgi:hypothetical protein
MPVPRAVIAPFRLDPAPQELAQGKEALRGAGTFPPCVRNLQWQFSLAIVHTHDSLQVMPVRVSPGVAPPPAAGPDALQRSL